MLLALLIACEPPCEKYCNDLAVTYGGLLDNADESIDTTSLAGADAEGGLDETAYAEVCSSAPDSTECESCTDWYSQTFLAPLGTTDACDYAYKRTDNYAGGEKACEQTCEAQGLTY